MTVTTENNMAQKNDSALSQIQRISPKPAHHGDNVLLGAIWDRSALSRHDRSLTTVRPPRALNVSGQLPFHLHKAREQRERVVTHVAFYVGKPAPANAANLLSALPNVEAV